MLKNNLLSLFLSYQKKQNAAPVWSYTHKKSVSHVNIILQNGKCYLSNIWLRMH